MDPVQLDRRVANEEDLHAEFKQWLIQIDDLAPLPRLGLEELDRDSVQRFLETTGQADLGVDLDRLLVNWRLAAGGHPTIAGMVLFGRDPQQHLPFAQINAVRFPGNDASLAPIDNKELKGRLLDVIDQAGVFLKLHLLTRHEIHGFEPERKPELPDEALREAVVNAVAHRDYTVHGPVRLFVFDDRVEFHAPGRAPNTVDAEAMRAGVHVPRNPHIYARLSDAGMVTRAGSGITRMIRLVRQATGKDIDIQLRDFEVLLGIPRKPAGQ